MLRQALTFAHSSFLMVLSDRQKENRKALLVQSAAEDSQPRIYFNRWETIREGNPQMMLDRGASVSLPPLLIMQGERMANGILVVAIDLRLARNRLHDPRYNTLALSEAPNLDATVTTFAERI